jgi:hypothetical protein
MFSVHLSEYIILAPSAKIFVKFYVGTFYFKNWLEISIFLKKSDKNVGNFTSKSEVRFMVAGDVKSPKSIADSDLWHKNARGNVLFLRYKKIFQCNDSTRLTYIYIVKKVI